VFTFHGLQVARAREREGGSSNQEDEHSLAGTVSYLEGIDRHREETEDSLSKQSGFVKYAETEAVASLDEKYPEFQLRTSLQELERKLFRC
jgi:hypothetical protein